MTIARRCVITVFLMICLLPVALVQRAAASPDDEAGTVAGDWRGDSVCVVKPSACHDEDSLYHFSPLPDKPQRFLLKADKIVDGKPVNMGTVECSHEPDKHTLTCEFERAVLDFTVRGEEMQGTMKLKDGTLWRKLSLKKVR